MTQPRLSFDTIFQGLLGLQCNSRKKSRTGEREREKGTRQRDETKRLSLRDVSRLGRIFLATQKVGRKIFPSFDEFGGDTILIQLGLVGCAENAANFSVINREIPSPSRKREKIRRKMRMEGEMHAGSRK